MGMIKPVNNIDSLQIFKIDRGKTSRHEYEIVDKVCFRSDGHLSLAVPGTWWAVAAKKRRPRAADEDEPPKFTHLAIMTPTITEGPPIEGWIDRISVGVYEVMLKFLF